MVKDKSERCTGTEIMVMIKWNGDNVQPDDINSARRILKKKDYHQSSGMVIDLGGSTCITQL